MVEQVDRLSRLTAADWERLKAELSARKIRVVATSWTMAAKAADEFTTRMFAAINGMLLDMLAAVARKDYDDRRRRQAQGQAKAKAEGRYKGRARLPARPENCPLGKKKPRVWGPESLSSRRNCRRDHRRTRGGRTQLARRRLGSASTPLRRSLNRFLLLTIRNDALVRPLFECSERRRP